FLDNVRLLTAGDLAFNGAFNVGGNRLTLDIGGTATQSSDGAITAKDMLLLGSDAVYELADADNDITTIAGRAGGIELEHAGSEALTVGTVNGTVGIEAADVHLSTSASTARLLIEKSVTTTNDQKYVSDLHIKVNAALTAHDGGDIELRANESGNNGANYRGIDVYAPIKTEDGNITLVGQGGSLDSNSVHGVFLSTGAVVETDNGSIVIHGTGATAEERNNAIGVAMNNAAVVRSTGQGSIDITGFGGNGGTYNNRGVLLQNATVESVDGNIHIEGTGGGADGEGIDNGNTENTGVH